MLGCIYEKNETQISKCQFGICNEKKHLRYSYQSQQMFIQISTLDIYISKLSLIDIFIESDSVQILEPQISIKFTAIYQGANFQMSLAGCHFHPESIPGELGTLLQRYILINRQQYLIFRLCQPQISFENVFSQATHISCANVL